MWICPVCNRQEYMELTCSHCGCRKGWTFSASCQNHVAAPGTPVLVNNDWHSVIVSHCVIRCSLHYILWREPTEKQRTAGEEWVVVSACRLSRL